MHAFIETIDGRYAGATTAIGKDGLCSVGSAFGADLFFPNDSLIAPMHFAIRNENDSLHLKTFNNQVFVNNQPTKDDAELKHGDFILAGGTLLYLLAEGEKSSTETPLGKLITRLSQIERLCLLIDENADTRILPLIKESDSNFSVLKDSVKNLEGLTANPILVELNKDYLEKFVRTFWGAGRLVFLEPREHSLLHFKHLLAKSQIENGVDLRFYDPRMLRTILGEADKQDAQFYFAGAVRYFVESQLPAYLFEIGWSTSGAAINSVRLSKSVQKIPTQKEIAEFLETRAAGLSFLEQANLFLREFLSINRDLRAEIAENLTLLNKFEFNFPMAKIQLTSLKFLLGEDFLSSEELGRHFVNRHFDNDDKLEFLVARLNLRRG